MLYFQRKSAVVILFVLTCVFVAVFIVKSEGYLSNSSQTYQQLPTASYDSQSCNACKPALSSLIGHLSIDVATLKEKPWQHLDEVRLGGKHRPSDCCPEEKMALIIPFRNRSEHLKSFVQHMHPFLIRQKRFYAIYVVEQADKLPFNRATLFNIGVQEALKQDDFDCFIFHDIDTLPANDRLIYKCSDDRDEVLQYSVFQSRWNYMAPHVGYSGGVIAITRDQFMRMNGFSNCYWGWGAEDDDTRFRAHVQNFKFTKIQDETARFVSLGHDKAEPSEARLKFLRMAGNRLGVDGLNSLKYRLLGVHVHPHYTKLRVLLGMRNMTSTCQVSSNILQKKLYNLFNFKE